MRTAARPLGGTHRTEHASRSGVRALWALYGRLPIGASVNAIRLAEAAVALHGRRLAVGEVLPSHPPGAVGASPAETELVAHQLGVRSLAVRRSVLPHDELDVTVPRMGTATVPMAVVAYELATVAIHYCTSGGTSRNRSYALILFSQYSRRLM